MSDTAITSVGGITLRPQVKNMNDINYNFNMLRWLVTGHIDYGNINEDAIDTLHVRDLAVTNAKIESMVADKILAGTIWAQIEIISPIITGGLIRTNVAGERIVLNDEGLYAFDENDDPRFELSKHSFFHYNHYGLRFFHTDAPLLNMEVARLGYYPDYYSYSMSALNQRNLSIDVSEAYLNLYATPGTIRMRAWGSGLSDVEIDADGIVYIYSDTRMEVHTPSRFYDNVAIQDLYSISGSINVHNALNISNGATGTFTSNDGKTVTVTNGIVTSIT